MQQPVAQFAPFPSRAAPVDLPVVPPPRLVPPGRAAMVGLVGHAKLLQQVEERRRSLEERGHTQRGRGHPEGQGERDTGRRQEYAPGAVAESVPGHEGHVGPRCHRQQEGDRYEGWKKRPH